MPTPDTNGLPPFADFDMMKAKINELVAKYNNLLVNLDSLNVVSLTADHIDAGTVNANLVKIRSDLTGGAYVQIDGNGMVINNGSFNTFTADTNGQVTMTRALIQSSPSGYPRIVMDPVSDLFGAYTSPTSYSTFRPNSSSSTSNAPVLDMTQSTAFMRVGHGVASLGGMGIYANSDFEINAMGGIFLSNTTYFNGWSTVRDLLSGNSLQDELTGIYSAINGKATSFVSTISAVGIFLNGGIAPGTQLLVAGGGSVSWSGINIPDHAHIQV